LSFGVKNSSHWRANANSYITEKSTSVYLAILPIFVIFSMKKQLFTTYSHGNISSWEKYILHGNVYYWL